MEPKLAFCYSAAIIAEIIALALQVMIMQKNLPVLNREVKKISTTLFLALLVILNIVDFLIVDVNIPVAKQIVLMYAVVLTTLFVQRFILSIRGLHASYQQRGSEKRYSLLLEILYNLAFLAVVVSAVLNTLRSSSLPILESVGVVPYLVTVSWLMLAVLNVYIVWESCSVMEQQSEAASTQEEDLLNESSLQRLRENYGLSDRELAMIRYLYQGINNAEIAEALGLSENTIKTYNFRLYKKLGVENRIQVVNKIREELLKQNGSR